MRINLCSGTDIRKFWLNLDIIAYPNCLPPDIYWDARKDELPFYDKSIEEAYCGYSLLHIQPRYRPFLLSEIHRVLIPYDGFVMFREVDMPKVMRRWLENPAELQNNQLIWGELGDVHGEKFAAYDTHHYGYSLVTLIHTLKEAGYSKLEQMVFDDDVWYDLRIRCRRGE